MPSPLNNQIALVTGANGGLGTHVTRALLDAGATVVGVARKIEPTVAGQPLFTGISADIISIDAAKQLAEQVVARFGRIDILAHLVGAFVGGKPIAETDEATMRQMFDLNFHSAFRMFRAVLPHMRAARRGRIIAIGSRAAEDPGPGVGAYSASKAALVSLVRTVARENANGITANVLLPGTMDTPVNRQDMPHEDFSKWVQPASVASLIVWLAGDGGKDVNGAVIPVYGVQP